MNITAQIRIHRRGLLHLLAVMACVVLSAAVPAAASAMVTGGGSATTPWIQSDEADYPPGATVTLDGGNWSAGESVHIVVDDTNGHTWHFTVDVAADPDGVIESTFTLPDAFISNYDVTATGPVSGTATTTFLDTNVNVKTTGVSSATVDWVRYNSLNCSGAPAASGQITATSAGNGAALPGGATTSQSLQLTAGAVSGSLFASWSGGNIPSPPNSANPICVAGDTPTQQIAANYAANTTRTTSTALALTTGTNPATYGSPLAYTATVTAPGGNPTNVGTVTFRNGTTVLCGSVPLASGTATCTPHLPAGAASLTAAYSGAASGSVQFTSSTSSSLAQTVSPKSLTILGAVAQSKTYDASTAATVDFSGASLDGVVSPDAVSIDSSSYAAAFASAAAGTGKAVSVSGVALSGADAGNYTVSQPGGLTATVAPRGVTASITAADKTYDGTADASITSCALEAAAGNHGVLAADAVGCDAANGRFSSKDAGSHSVTADVSLTGADSDNYELTSSSAATGAVIAQRPVTATITAADKTYDGTTDAALTGCALEAAAGDHGVLAADAVGCDGANAVFGSSQAGLRAVSADVSLTGADSANYALTSDTAATSATIDRRPVTASITAADKTYDGTADASITSCALEAAAGNHGVLAADAVGCDGSAGVFGSSQAGLRAVTADVSLTGADSENYALTSGTAATSAMIDERPVTASVTVADKTYDGTADAAITSCALEAAAGNHGVLAADAVGCDAANGRFSSKDAGSHSVTADVSLTGADSANYALTSGTAATSATIEQRPVTASITAADKTYDGTAGASMTSCALEAAAGEHGVLAADAVGCDAANGRFGSKDAGSHSVTADVSLTGADSGNYELTSGTAATSAMIDERPVTASITAAGKTYDGTTDAAITGCTLEAASGEHGVLAADAVGCDAANGRFASSDAGSHSVTADVSLTGADSANYRLTSSSAATGAVIAQRPVTATITAADKTYDSTTDAQITACMLEAATGGHGVLAGDDVSCETSGGQFASANAGSHTVTADVALSGGVEGDYRLTSATAATTAMIGQAPLHISAQPDSKRYDATTTSTGMPAVASADVQGSDTVDGLVQAFQSKDALGPDGSTLQVAGYVVHDGNGGGNYSVIISTASGTITAAPLHLSAVTDSRQYNGTTSSNGTPTVKDGDLQGSDSVDGLTQAFQSKNVMGTDASTLQVTGYAVHDGNGGNNYDVATATAPGTITPAPLHLIATSDVKQYDGTTTSAAAPTMKAGDLQGADTVTGVTQSFASKNVLGANASTLQINPGYVVHDGNGGNNYGVSAATASGTITAKPLTVTGIAAANRPWDGGTAATLNTSGATLNGVIAPDDVGLDTSAASGIFANSGVGTWTVQIAGLLLTGADKSNYSLTQPTTSASIGAWYATGFYDPVGISSSLFVPAPGPAPAAAVSTVWNTVKGGSTVPLKFNVYTSRGGSELKSTTSIGAFDAVKLPVCAGDTGDPVDFVTTGNTSLRYDTTGLQFIQNWKTPSAAAGSCYRIDVRFQDGSAVYAFFKLTK